LIKIILSPFIIIPRADTRLEKLEAGVTYMDVGGRVMHDSKDGGGRATQEAKAEEQLPIIRTNIGGVANRCIYLPPSH